MEEEKARDRKEQIHKKEEKPLKTIEELYAQSNIRVSVYAGVRIMKKWKPGKRVTEEEFNDAVNIFLGRPVRKKV